MTKKAKTKTKSDEAPPKSVPPEKQSTEPGAGAAADQKSDAAPPPQPPTPAGAGSAPQPEAPKPQDSSPAAVPAPAPPDAKSGEAKASEPTAAVAPEAPSLAKLGPIGSPPGKTSSEKPPPAQASAPAPAPLGAVGSPPEKTPAVQPPIQLGAVGSPLDKPPVAPAPAMGSPPGKTPAAQETVQLGAVGSPPEKVSAAPTPAQLRTTGPPSGKPPATQTPAPIPAPAPSLPPAQLGAVGSPPVKTTPAQEPIQLGAIRSSPEKSPAVQAPAPAPAQLGALGNPAEKLPPSNAPAQVGIVGSVVQKPPDLKQDNTSNSEPKPNTLVKSGSQKEQPTSSPSTQPSFDGPSLSPIANEKKSETAVDKSLTEKGSKTVAPPKAQSADKNQKVSPTTPKVAPNGQPSKKPAEKQNKRQTAKESAGQKDDPNVNKAPESNIKQSSNDKVIEKPKSSNEPKTAKDNTVAKSEDIASTQIKDAPTKSNLAGAASETLPKQSNASGVSKKAADAEPPKPKDSNKNITAPSTENIKSIEKPEKSKDSTGDGKKAEQKVDSDPATQGKQQKPVSPKSDPSEKGNKNAPPKKNKQKNETGGPKTEGSPSSKEARPADKGGKKDTTKAATGSQPSPEVSEAKDSSKKSSSNTPADTASKLPTLEAAAPDHSAQAKEVGDKKQETKVTPDFNEGKEGPTKDDAQSKSSGKKKNRQQKKSVSEDVKPSEEKENKGPQEVGKSKNNEKKKPAPAPPSKEKEKEPKSATASAPAEKNRKNVSSESAAAGAKVSAGKPPTAEKSPVPASAKESHVPAGEDSSGKTPGVSDESQPGEEGASKKKKRNRHKKKSKAGGGDSSTEPNVEGGKQQDANVTAGSGERKAKEKQQTIAPTANKSKGQQKDSQPGQANASKGAQPGPATAQGAQASSETPALTASAKKRNRRKKKGASGTEKESETDQPQENKSVESKETPAAKPEEQKAKVNIPSTQTKADEVHKKKADSKPAPKPEKPPSDEGTEDQSENFVEVKSKNKRNKKKKQDAAEAKEDSAISLSSSNNVPKGVAEANKTETENTGKDAATEVTNKVAAPKISQEAREQKMLNKKLAERAQLKIQKQIETNALSEVEKSEKYLETITKNLRELTKLRSSRLEDVIQKPGEEEFDYEYTPVQRVTFLATTCHVCKEFKPKEATRICEQCHLMSYCSEEHQKSDWSAHKDLCQAISDMCKERGTGNLYTPAVGLSAEEYRAYRMNALLECSAILNRQLEPYEQEIILYPNLCHTCHLPSASSLHTCESCSMVSYCSPEHRPPNHDVWCHDLQLYKSLIIYQSRNGVISPQLPVFLPESFQPLGGDMQSHLRTLAGGIDASPLERAVLSEIATGPLTALFALQKSNKVSGSTEKLVIHFVGAEWSFEMERADKWEAFLLHQIPSLKSLVLVFVGPEVCNLPPEARGLLQKQSTPCPQCQERGRRVELVIAPQTFYHEYVASQDYVAPTLICAYNAGLYRPKGHKDVDSWAYTVEALLKDPGVPVAVTSYTAEEVLKDAERLQQHRPLNFILPPSQNPYRSLRPNRNFASDDVTPVIFKNYYLMIATSLAQ